MKHYMVGQKSKPAHANFCHNFVYCRPMFIIFGTHTQEAIGNRGFIDSSSNMVCTVTALPYKILITTFATCLYMSITINNNKYPKICTLDTIHVKKQHKELRHIIEIYIVHGHGPWDLLLHAHCCQELLETKV